MNNLTINGYQAVIAFDPDIQMFRGEFVSLNGGADFYAADVAGLKHEGEISLRVFLEACARHASRYRTALNLVLFHAKPRQASPILVLQDHPL